MKLRSLFAAVVCLGLLVIAPGSLQAQRDPGPRSGDAGAGGPLPTLNPDEQSFFSAALKDFMEVDSVSGNIPGEDSAGLGPKFNGNSCADRNYRTQRRQVAENCLLFDTLQKTSRESHRPLSPCVVVFGTIATCPNSALAHGALHALNMYYWNIDAFPIRD